MAKSANPTGKRAARGRSGPGAEVVGRNVAAVRDIVVRSVLAPLNAVLLSRRHIEEVVDDAVRRGRMTRDDAQQLVQSLLQHGARQTEDFLADLERLVGKGRTLGEDERAAEPASDARPSRSRAAAPSVPFPGYDDLSAAQVQGRLDDLTVVQLRRVRDYERRHANRKTVLDPIERKLKKN